MRQTAENARLRKVEAAALAALADLDALIGDPQPIEDERRRQGSVG